MGEQLKRRVLTLGVLVACSGGCATENDSGPVVHWERLTAAAEGSDIVIDGLAGAVEPATGTVVLVNVDRAARGEAYVHLDGHLSVAVRGRAGDELRLEVVQEGRSEPMDFQVSEVDGIVPSMRAMEWCLVSEPASQLELPADGQATVLVRNQCEVRLDFAAPRFLAVGEANPYGVDPNLTFELRPGEEHSLQIMHRASRWDSDLLIVAAFSPAIDRRPITVTIAPP